MHTCMHTTTVEQWNESIFSDEFYTKNFPPKPFSGPIGKFSISFVTKH